MQLIRNMSISALLLALFAVIGVGLVSMTYQSTAEQIAENQRLALLDNLHELIPPQQHDNDIYHDTIQIVDKRLSGSNKPVMVYRARKNGQPVAAVINAVAPDGYSGDIYLLVAIQYNGTLAGVRVIEHRETPGLGDAIELSHSDWIKSFTGKSLSNPNKKGWAVKRDGGIFDQFTGATITPRAVVNAVYNSLRYFSEHRERLFSKPDDQGDGST